MKTLRRLWRDEEAATATEYGIIAAFLAVGLITILFTLRKNLIAMFQGAADGVAQGAQH